VFDLSTTLLNNSNKCTFNSFPPNLSSCIIKLTSTGIFLFSACSSTLFNSSIVKISVFSYIYIYENTDIYIYVCICVCVYVCVQDF